MKISTSTKPYVGPSEKHEESMRKYGFVFYVGIDPTSYEPKPLLIQYKCNNSCRK